MYFLYSLTGNKNKVKLGNLQTGAVKVISLSTVGKQVSIGTHIHGFGMEKNVLFYDEDYFFHKLLRTVTPYGVSASFCGFTVMCYCDKRSTSPSVYDISTRFSQNSKFTVGLTQYKGKTFFTVYKKDYEHTVYTKSVGHDKCYESAELLIDNFKYVSLGRYYIFYFVCFEGVRYSKFAIAVNKNGSIRYVREVTLNNPYTKYNMR